MNVVVLTKEHLKNVPNALVMQLLNRTGTTITITEKAISVQYSMLSDLAFVSNPKYLNFFRQFDFLKHKQEGVENVLNVGFMIPPSEIYKQVIEEDITADKLEVEFPKILHACIHNLSGTFINLKDDKLAVGLKENIKRLSEFTKNLVGDSIEEDIKRLGDREEVVKELREIMLVNQRITTDSGQFPKLASTIKLDAGSAIAVAASIYLVNCLIPNDVRKCAELVHYKRILLAIQYMTQLFEGIIDEKAGGDVDSFHSIALSIGILDHFKKKFPLNDEFMKHLSRFASTGLTEEGFFEEDSEEEEEE